MSEKIKIDDQLDIIIETELDKIFKISTTPGSSLDDKELKKLEILVKLHELRRKNSSKENEGKLTKKDIKSLVSAARQQDDG